MNLTKPIVVCIPYVGDTIGGSHISSLILAENLDKDKFKVKIVLHRTGVLSDYLTKKNIEYFVLDLKDIAGRKKNVVFQGLSLFRSAPKLVKYIRSEKIDIVHTHDARMHIVWSLPVLITGVVHIWHQRTLWAKGRLANYLVRFSSRVVVISDFVRESLPRSVKHKSIIVWNPIEQTNKQLSAVVNRKKLIQKLGCHLDGKLVVSVGNLISIKQPMLFIEAALLLLELSKENLVFIVVGDDRENYYPRMKAHIAEKGMENRFFFMGFHDNVLDIISASDLLLATSKADAFGRTIVEAMSVGVPVIAVDMGGHSEIITHDKTGCLVPDNDPNAIAKTAIKLFDDYTLRNTIIDNALCYAKSFSPIIHCEKIEKIYDIELDL